MWSYFVCISCTERYLYSNMKGCHNCNKPIKHISVNYTMRSLLNDNEIPITKQEQSLIDRITCVIKSKVRTTSRSNNAVMLMIYI